MQRLCLWLALLPGAALAQPTRTIEGELSGNFFFGNTRQVLTSTRLQFERADSAFAVTTMARFNYGEAHTTPGSGAIVSKRSWDAGAKYERSPFGAVSPFVRLAMESSFENRIARRQSGTLGMRYTIVRTPSSEFVVRTGVAGERTAPLPPGDSAGITTLARGTTSAKIRRAFNDRVALTSEATYQPALSFFGDYTILSLTVLKIELSSFAGLTLSLRDAYDSRAVLRGARTNNDGEVLVGVLTTF